MLIERAKNNYLGIIGVLLPYAFVIIVFCVVALMPHENIDQKWEQVGLFSFAPFIASLLGSILVGVNIVLRDIKTHSTRNKFSGFFFGFFWTAVFHFFVTLYIFMQIVYTMFGGLKH